MHFIAGFPKYLAPKNVLSVGSRYGNTTIRADTVLDSHETQGQDLRGSSYAAGQLANLGGSEDKTDIQTLDFVSRTFGFDRG